MPVYTLNGETASNVYDVDGNTIATGETEEYVDGRLVLFKDDFDKGYLDEKNWIAENRNSFGNRSIQAYTGRSENVRVENSNLIITAKREPYWGKQWTSAQIVSRGLQEFKYGRFEARMKLSAFGTGIWPAFWTLGRTWYSSDAYTINWAKCGEIDFFDPYEGDSVPYFGIHYDLGNGHQSNIKHVSAIDMTEYHVFAGEWTESKIEMFIDGVSIGSFDTSNLVANDGWYPFRNPHFLLLCLQVAPNVTDSTPNEVNMYVDWVRVLAPEGVTSRVYPTAVNLSGTVNSMAVGDTAKLIATVEPSNATEQTVNWRSENELKAQMRGGQVTKLQNEPCSVSAVCDNGVHADFIIPYTES